MAAVVHVVDGAVSVVGYQAGDFSGRRLRFSTRGNCSVTDDVCGGNIESMRAVRFYRLLGRHCERREMGISLATTSIEID